ncbi:hypothetical protein FACS1894158_01920 [Betaproteobacteria bacterium]|nr:hypothetical protein FACS1894158_01920 [Betaproteobacteria bacterium]
MVLYDETKRKSNIKDHGLDFVGCEAIFSGPTASAEDTREAYGERRVNVIGFLNGQIVCLTYTERGENLRVISLRKANRNETRYFAKTLSFHS